MRAGDLPISAGGHLFGGFLGDKLVGFIGEHPEGSIGILEVLPEFRPARLCL